MTQKAAKQAESPEMQQKVQMDDLVSLCKRRGFVFHASEIYGGINGFWDYGPLGVQLKNNLRDRWWRDMVIAPPIGPDGKPLDIVGVDSSIIQHPKAWEASGHIAGFSDPMVDCKETKKRYRADHLKVFFASTPISSQDLSPENIGSIFAVEDFFFATDKNIENLEEDHRKSLKKLGAKLPLQQMWSKTVAEIPAQYYSKIWAPGASAPGTLTEPKQFNLMFKTYVGATATENDVAYLRPETAQGIFLNYKNVLSSSRVKIPFGIAQIGKAFRNEVTPRNFIYRSREFEQMEMEWFCEPEDAKKWFDFWVETRKEWWKSVGVSDESLLIRPHDKDELSHYAKEGYGTVDVEYRFPFTYPGFGELEGIAHRCAFDLTQHEKHSGVKHEYFDDQTQKRYIPHVIEPASGLTRGVLALLAEAYTPDLSRPSGVYMKFNPAMAPVKAAVLPLVNKEGMPEVGEKLYMSLRSRFVTEYDPKQNIGKRYARHDEIGTPFCLTIDGETLTDQTVTVRHRDTMKQERIGLDSVSEFISKHIES